MDWLDKIPKWIQIPLKILLPALCIFSGFLLLISDNLAKQLYLKEFREESGFAFGLIFVITISLISVYVLSFGIVWIKKKIQKYLEDKQIAKDVLNSDDFEKLIFFGLYNANSNMQMLNGNNPIVGKLVRKGYIFSTNQSFKLDRLSNFLEMTYSLSDRVIRVIDKVFSKTEKELEKLKGKVSKEKNEDKQKQYSEEIKEIEKTIKMLKNIKFKEGVYYG